MSDLVLLIVFTVMLAAGGFIIRKIDFFIARHVVKYPEGSEEAKQHDPFDEPDA